MRTNEKLIDALSDRVYTIELYRLRLKLLKKGQVLIIPVVATALFIGIMYSMTPIGVTSSFLLSAAFMYFVCVFISMTLNGKENDVFEETQYSVHLWSLFYLYAKRG